MTLGDFRRITAGLPDDAVFINAADVISELNDFLFLLREQEQMVDIRSEYYKSELDGTIQRNNNRIYIEYI